MDLHEQFKSDVAQIVEGEHPVVIFGNQATAEYELFKLPVDDQPGIAQKMAARGLAFIGAVGIVDGEPKSALIVPVGAPAIKSLVKEYCRIVEKSLYTALSETVELYRLWAKPSNEYDA